MKVFNNFILSYSKINDSFLLIPRPFVNDIYDIIQEFNEDNTELKNGVIFMDLQTIVGNRKKKYVSFEIINYKIKRNSKTVFNDTNIQMELENLKLNFYKQINKDNLYDLIIKQSCRQPLN